MLKVLFCYFEVFLIFSYAYAMPQDLEEAAIIAAAQAKEAIDNGAAVRYEQSVEVLGANFHANMEVGYGDAIKSKREVKSEKESSDAYSDVSYSDYEEYDEEEES
ncbi:uncharacterized protein LOC142231993 [Haematobia irritans]|uniref:uncharacterized protein LOC142231993 n=1 Tax=Haematobia irritans TaxID=7368 RepID=UPI003F500A85